MKKQLTPTIARALAERVFKNVEKSFESELKDAETDYKLTKEWKALEKAEIKRTEALEAYSKAEQKLVDIYKSGPVKIRYFNRDDSGKRTPSFYSGKSIGIEQIKNSIMLADYMSTENLSVDELVDELTDKILKGQI